MEQINFPLFTMLSAHSFPSFFSTIMNASIRKFTFFLTAFLLGCLSGHAYEQDNWYLHGPLDGNLTGVFHQEYDAVNKRDMLYKTVAGVGLEVRDINGTLLQTINTGGITFTDIEYDQNTSRLFGINSSKLTCFEQNASGGWSEQWRSTQSVSSLAQSPSGKLFCANNGNKIYVFEQNGTKNSEFGWVDGINQLGNDARVVGFVPGDKLVAFGELHITGGSTLWSYFFFRENGEVLSRKLANNAWDNRWVLESKVPPSRDGSIYYQFKHRSYYTTWDYKRYFNTVDVSKAFPSVEVSLWLQNGDFISGTNLYRRTFRTKMETYHNSVPQPVIHRIAQRAGTNILELDFEVIDTDDDNVTVGILAYCGSDKVVPQAWLNGSASKIGTPIATNTVHSMVWDVKQDWPNSTGSIKFEILCQDGSRDKPVDLHFLNLPFADGNMTISRSPLRDSDFVNYAKYLLATGQAQFKSNNSNAVVFPAEANTTEVFTFTNCGATGRNGPTEAQIQGEYNGTNLQGLVTTGWKAGYQKWTVPATGDYWIEAVGAQGGDSGTSYVGGRGAFLRGKFSLSLGQELNIIVGQQGESDSNNHDGAGGGGGSFVVADTNNTILLIAGAGGGAGLGRGIDASISSSGIATGNHTASYNGEGGEAAGYTSGGGGGFLTNGSVTSSHVGQGGKSYQDGALGGIPGHSGAKGGFGGGGSVHATYWYWGGGGGGFSGGSGGSGGSTSTGFNGGGGGSFNSGNNKESYEGFGVGHGVVRIYRAEGVTPTRPSLKLLNNNWKPLGILSEVLKELGSNYRFATPAEVTKAREAATPGGVNNWTASNQVKPRNLPGSVNEYGFDVSTTSGYWVIKE
jgi:hypothetical protein